MCYVYCCNYVGKDEDDMKPEAATDAKLPVESQMEISASAIREKKKLKFIAESTTKKEIESVEVSS